MTRILVVDNYDSFVHNLVQYLGQLGAEPIVRRNDEVTAAEALAMRPEGLLVSPGPGRPEQAGASCELIAGLSASAPPVPVLGVCLGHQCIAHAFGARIERHAVMHGKTSEVSHDGRGIFDGLPDPMVATRYHSLVVEAGSLPNCLEATAWSEDGALMGLRHRVLPAEGVQFHPESILTAGGHRLLANWLATCGHAVPSGAVEAAEASLRR